MKVKDAVKKAIDLYGEENYVSNAKKILAENGITKNIPARVFYNARQAIRLSNIKTITNSALKEIKEEESSSSNLFHVKMELDVTMEQLCEIVNKYSNVKFKLNTLDESENNNK